MSPVRDTGTPLRILVCALGGEGGGVLVRWIVAAARSAGFRIQATSVPGVAQRTGSTSYYLEIWERGAAPVPSLVPMPGRVDVVLASELAEAARAIEAGFVSLGLTTLIASTSRTYATAEKVAMGDGRLDGAAVGAAARTLAKSAHLLDLQELAVRHGTFISATLFGALAASGVLPWSVEVSRGVLGAERSAAAVASLGGMDAAIAAVGEGDAEATPGNALPPAPPGAERLPASLRDVIAHGHARVLDFQDERYADLYAERVGTLLAVADLADPPALHAVTEASRRLALWMAYEDVARVADLKTRRERFRRIRAESRMRPGQILKVTEYLKPRAEEVADILPVGIGRRIMARVEAGKGLPGLGRGIRVRSNGAPGYWMLRFVASLRRIRRRSLRYHREQRSIEEWLQALTAALPASAAFAGALAELPRLRKGYSDTMQRGLAAWSAIMEAVVRPALGAGVTAQDADRLRKALAAALADENHAALDAVLAGKSHAALDAMLAGEGAPAGVAVPAPVPPPKSKPERELANVH